MWDTCKTWLAQYNLWDDRMALKLFSGLLFPHAKMPGKIRHIVVYRVGNIGDTVVAIPALIALREAFPEAKMTLLTSAGSAGLPGAADVLIAFPGVVDSIVTYLPSEIKSPNGLQRLKSKLTEPGPIDLWVSLPVTLQTVIRGFREILMARWLGSQCAFGFSLLLPEVFKTEFARKRTLPKTSDWLLSMVNESLHHGIPPKNREGLPHGIQKEQKSLPGNPSDRQNDSAIQQPDCMAYFKSPAPNLPHRLGLSPERPLLVVNAGAKLAIKRWPESAFRETVNTVLQKMPAVQVVLLGNQAERNWNENIAQNLPGIILNAAGQLTLAETWSLIHAASAVLTNDTGAMHMGGLLGKKVFTPMSGQYPAPLWHPPQPSSQPLAGADIEIFSHPTPCAPCFKETCPLPQQLCLTEISPREVAEAIYRHLRQTAR